MGTEIAVESSYPAFRHEGTICRGTIRSGEVRVGDEVVIVRPDGASIVLKVRGLESVHGPEVPRDTVGLLFDHEADPYLVPGSSVRDHPSDIDAR